MDSMIHKANVYDIIELTGTQQGMLFHYLKEEDRNLYNIQLVFEIEGSVDEKIMNDALKIVQAENESLRSVFNWEKVGKFLQIILKEHPLSLCYQDVSGMDKSRADAIVQQCIHTSRHNRFDLTKLPLRLDLIKTTATRYIFVMTHHHILYDGWSTAVFLKELLHAYGRLMGDNTVTQQRPRALYSEMLKKVLEQRNSSGGETFWKKYLSGCKAALSLPANTAAAADDIQKLRYTLPAAAINRFCADHKITLAAVIYAAYSLLLHKYSQVADVVFGTTVSCRDVAVNGAEAVIGNFMNTVPFRVAVKKGMPLAAFVQLVNDNLREVSSFGTFSYFEIKQLLQVPAGQELFNTLVAIENYPVDQQSVSGTHDFTVRLQEVYEHTSIPLALYVFSGEEITIEFVYKRAEVADKYAAALSARFKEAVQVILADTGGLVEDVCLFPEEERAAVFQSLASYDEQAVSAPVSYHQQRLWLAHKMAVETGQNTAWMNVPVVMELDGAVQPERIYESVREVAKRYAILSTAIIEKDELLFQEITTAPGYHWQYTDLCGNEQAAAAIITGEVNTAPEFSGPMLRAGMVKVQAEKYRLYFIFHHAVADRHTALTFCSEVLSYYNTLTHGGLAATMVPLFPYTGYSRWQQERLHEIAPYYLDYWTATLGSHVKALEMPVDHSRPAILTYARATVDVNVPDNLATALSAFGKERNTGIGTLLMAAFKILLWKYCRHEEIIIGTAIPNRDQPVLTNIAGPVSSLVVIKSLISSQLCFDEYIITLKEMVTGAAAHSALPFERLAQQLASPADLSRNMLFDVFFQYTESFVMPPVDGLSVQVTEPADGTGSYDLNLFLRQSAANITGTLTYNAACFDRDTIVAFAEYYYTLLSHLLSAPSTKLADIEVASAAQRQHLLELFNNTHTAWPEDKNIIDLFKEQVKRQPGNIAVSLGRDSLTYAELDRLSDRLAHTLIKTGTGPDKIIALLTDRSLEMLTGMLAILKAGGAYLPIDVDYPEERINYLITDSGTTTLLTVTAHRDKVVGGVTVVYMDEITDGEELPEVICPAKADNLCYVIYTSGTTGNPKGVMVEHRNVVRLLFNEDFQYDFSSEDVWTMFHSHCFDVSVWEIYGALLRGGRLIIIPKAVARDTSAYLHILSSERVTILNQTPSAFYSLMQQDLSAGTSLNVRCVVFAGEALSPGKLAAWHEKYPHVKLVNMYGITETTVHSTYKEIGLHEIRNNTSNIGKPLPTLLAYLLDEHGKVVPRGVTGELYIGGAGVTRGYLGKPELTEKVFLRDPYGITDRVYRSGDLARILPNGEIEYLGRIDHQVQLRGFRIELGEIESQLGKHPSIKEVVVLDKGMDEHKFLVAYYIPTSAVDAHILRAYLSDKLPEYMVPSFFIQMDQMPLTPNGKLDRRALPDPEITGAIDYVAPENETELVLTEIWADILQVRKEHISTHESFFTLGGHSLNASVLVNRITKRFHVKIPLQEIFNQPDVKSLSRLITGKQKSTVDPLIAVPEKQYYKVTSSQKRLFFLYELNRSSLAYNMPYVLRLEGIPDLDRLTDAFQRLVQRHEILRTCFAVVNGIVMQRVLADVTVDVPYYEAAGDERMCISRFVRPFDLAAAPLIRMGVAGTGADNYLLLFDIHHIVNDGVATQVILHDFFSLYHQRELLPLPFQYKDYAEWQQGAMQQERIAGQRQFWLDIFPDDIKGLDLPLDFARPSFKNDEGGSIDFTLTAAQTAQLKVLAREQHCTLFMVLLAAYHLLLAKLTDQEDIVIGVPVAGRQHADVEKMPGLFINLLALRNKFEGNQRFSDFLLALKQHTIACFEHQDYPYEQLIEQLDIARDVSRNPLFDVLFLFQNFEEATFSVPGMSPEPYEYTHPVAKVDLTLMAMVNGPIISFRFEYAASLFKATTIQRFAEYFNRIIDAVLSGKDHKIADIEMLSEEERNTLLYTFNQTQLHYPQDATIVSLFGEQVLKSPGNVCVAFEGHNLTYRELDEAADRLALQLKKEYNIGRGSFVAVKQGRSWKMLVSLLGIMKAGGAYVTIDPATPAERTRYILEDSGAKVLLTDEVVAPDFYEGAVLPIDHFPAVYEGHREILSQPAPEDTCYMIYTSGSTGMPKGVMINHRSVVNFFAGMNDKLQLESTGSLLAVTSIAFDISVLELFWTLCHGRETVIFPSDHQLSNLDRYVTTEDKAPAFSLSFFSSYNNEEADKYDLLLKAVEYADKAGFEAVWTPERHFHAFGGLYPNPSVLSAALAMTTRQIRIRAGSVVAPLHNTLRTAEEWAVVDNLSGGRIGISFASGWNPDDFSLAPDSYTARHTMMYAQIAELKQLWAGNSVTRINGLGQEVQLKVFPAPLQTTLPVWITSAGNAETFRSAGAMGANLLTHFLGQDITMLAHNISIYRAARKQNGYDEGRVTLMVHTYIGEEMEQVEATVKAPFIAYLKSAVGLSKVIFEQAGFKEGDLTEELKDKIIHNAFRRYYKENALIGTKESCAAMAWKLKAIGVDEMACLIDFGVEKNVVLAGLERLKELKDMLTLDANHQPVTVMQSTPSFINLLMNDPGSARFFQSLKTLLVGGESLPVALLDKIRQKNPALAVYNMYGPTETTIWSCVHKFEGEVDRISIGKPISNTQIYILNKQLQLVPVGVTGDLYIGGDGLAAGYWGRPQLTAEKFISNPFKTTDKIYHTGDLAKWLPDGNIELIGRKDFQVKLHGFRVELEEIEYWLRNIAGIQDAVVVVREEEGNTRLAAYVTPSGVSEALIREQLAKKLPHYMVPAYIVPLEKFPLTSSGKLNRLALPAPAQRGDKERVAPQTPGEQLLADVWATVLGATDISVTDNFFSSGGDSIKSIQIISRLQAAGYQLSVKDIFTTQHIRELALRLQHTTVSDQSDITGAFTLTPVQRWFFEGPVLQQHHYNQAVMLTFREPLQPAWVKDIFQKIQQHHDALRLVFSGHEGKITAETKDTTMPVSLEVFDLKGSTDAAGDIQRQAAVLQAGIRLESGPLMKLGLFLLEEESKLLVVVHHLVIDGISWRILFEDIDTLYQQLKKQETLRLPLKTDAFASWSQQLIKYSSTSQAAEHKRYWQHYAARTFVKIPRDYPESSSLPGSKNKVQFQLNVPATQQLLTGVHATFGTQINDILLAALLIGIRKLYGNVTATIDLEGHGREEIAPGINYSRTVGWFTSIFPLALEAVTEDIPAAIKQVKEVLRQIPGKGLDFLLMNYMDEQNAGTRPDRSQIMFNYLGQFNTDIKGKSFTADYESAGPVVAEEEPLHYDWDILSVLVEDHLSVSLTYSGQQYSAETIGRLMDLYHSSLQEIIHYCTTSQRVYLTPADLTYKSLSIPQVEKLEAEYELEDVCTLAPMQEAILFHALMDANSPYYFVQIAYRLTGSLDMALVEKSFYDLAQRHTAFRTVFLHNRFQQPVQLMFKEGKKNFIYTDKRDECTKDNREAVITACKLADRHHKFNINNDSLVRLTVIRTGPTEFEFIWSYHHLVMDGWCIGIIFQDFKTIYAANLHGERPLLSPAIPYTHYIKWLQQQDAKAARQYWKNYLFGYDNAVMVPGKEKEGKTGSITNEQRNSQRIVLGNETTALLQEVSAKYAVTTNTILQVAWGVLLSRYNNTDDVLFGAVVSGRPAAITGVESMVGLFMNTIPVRIRFDEGQRVAEVLKAQQQEALAATPYHFSPLPDIMSLNGKGRELINHLLIFENFPVTEVVEGNHAGAYQISDVEMFDQNDYDFYIIIVPGKEITIRFDYNPAVYSDLAVTQTAARFLNIIQQLLTRSEEQLLHIELAAPAERQLLQEGFNSHTVVYPQNETVISLFEKQAARSPQLTAVKYEDESISYETLNARADALAQRIQHKLPSPGNHKIGLLFEPSADVIVAMLAVLKAGCAYVPLSPEAPAERNRYILGNCDAKLLIVQDHLFYNNYSGAGIFNPQDILLVNGDTFSLSGNSPVISPSPEDLIYVIYTSGTTGTPKGVELEHRGIVNMLYSHQDLYRIEEGAAVSQVANLIFDASAFEIWPALTQGACLHIASRAVKMDPDLMKEWLITNRITFSYQTTVVAQHLLKMDWASGAGALKVMNIAGDRLNYIPEGPLPFKVYNLYGPTEDAIWTTWTAWPYEGAQAYYSIGRPIGNKRIYILDSHHRLQPVGVTGEICIAGDGLARGYVQDAQLTAEKFITLPALAEKRLYRTGDSGRWREDGNIEFFGRIDNQVKIRGFRVEPGEIGFQLSSCPGITEAVVIAKEQAGELQLLAYYVAAEALPEEELRSFLKDRVPDYMMPSCFVYLKEFPLTPGGKIDRKALPDPVWGADAAFIAPANEVEKHMAAIWSEVLEIEEHLISADKSFFQLGGHSLKVMTMVKKINDHYHTGLSLNDVFEKEKLRDLADYLITINRPETEPTDTDYTINIVL